MITRHARMKMTLIASAIATATSAFAAESQVEEVVVTAQKRAESLQDVSVSVAVTTAEELLGSGIKDAEILSQQMPAINISKGGASDQMYIRGIGSGFNGGFEQAVGTYIDGLYIGRSRGTRASFVDLERIEVLKGPQSLYFGNSSIAGALSLTSQAPTREFGGHFIALYEPDHEETNFEGAINLPMGEEFAVRVAARKYDLDGYVDNTWTGQTAGGADDVFARVSALWQPTDRFKAVLKYATGESDRTSPFMKEVINCPSPYGSTNPLASCNAQGNLLDNRLNYKLQGGGDDFSKGDFTQTSLAMDYDLDALTVSSITGWIDNRQRELQDLDSGPMFIFNNNQYDDLEQFSQELRLASDTGGVVEWMAGVYFQDGDVRHINVQAPYFNAAPAFQAAVAATRASGRELGARQDYVQAETTTSAFGSVTWNINDSNRLISGVRWIEVEKDVDKAVVWGSFSDRTLAISSFQQVAPPFAGYQTVGVNTASEKWDDVLPTVIVEHDLSADAMVYASFSQGFKAGGYDFQNRDARVCQVSRKSASIPTSLATRACSRRDRCASTSRCSTPTTPMYRRAF